MVMDLASTPGPLTFVLKINVGPGLMLESHKLPQEC